MKIVHLTCKFSLTAPEITEQRDFSKRCYRIDSNGQTVGNIGFHPEIKQWAIETRSGFALTLGFTAKVYETVLAMQSKA